MPGEMITGRIAATPNPIPFAEGSKATISWQTTDPAGAEVRVSIPTGGEKLVSRGNGGSVEVPWIQPRSDFEFRLYSGSEPSRLLDHVTVRRDDGSWEKILDPLASEPGWENTHLPAVANYIAKVIPRCLNHPQFHDLFLQWEQHGFHVTPVHFYQPIPDTRTLTEAIWAKPGSLTGVDLNEAGQLDLLRNVFPHFRNEYDAIPQSATGKRGEFYFDNGLFSGTDALVTYCMVRHFQPRLRDEVLGHQVPRDQMFLDDPLEHRRVTIAIPRALGIYDRDGAVLTDPEAVCLRAQNAMIGKTQLDQPTFQIVPRHD